MPTPAEGLTRESADDAVKQAISATVRQLVEEGFEQRQAVAIAFSQARKSTGKELAQGNAEARPSRLRRAS